MFLLTTQIAPCLAVPHLSLHNFSLTPVTLLLPTPFLLPISLLNDIHSCLMALLVPYLTQPILSILLPPSLTAPCYLGLPSPPSHQPVYCTTIPAFSQQQVGQFAWGHTLSSFLSTLNIFTNLHCAISASWQLSSHFQFALWHINSVSFAFMFHQPTTVAALYPLMQQSYK